jgi:adenine-specific DNA-methyltransferase
MEKLDLNSPDLTGQNIDKLAVLFPDVVTEDLDHDGKPVRAIDFDLLRQELSDHVVEGPQERYQLNWPGKRRALFDANAPVARTLRPVREESVEFDTTQNLFVQGDNLDALKLLQESYLGKVQLIYVDPPYNTGNDLIYDDDYAQTALEYLERSSQIDEGGNRLVANPESNGRFHSDWLSMMYPRLKLARSLLADSGILLLSVDDVEVASVRLLIGEIFGQSNFIGTIIHQRAKGGGNARHLVRGHDYVLAAARDIRVVTPLRRNKVVQGKIETIDGVDYLVDDDVLRKTFGKYQAGTERRCLYEEILEYKGEEKKAEIDAQLKAGELFLIPWAGGGHAVARRTPVSEAKSKLYSIIRVLSEEGAADLASLQMDEVFSYPKPRRLMQQLVQAAAQSDGDVVMDLFSGSASMIHGLFDQSVEDGIRRRFIAVQCEEDLHESLAAASGPARKTIQNAIRFTSDLGVPATVAEIAKERIRRAGASVQLADETAGSIDVGFRVLSVDSTNLTDVLRPPDALEQGGLDLYTDSVKPDRTGEDLLFQVLLDWGLELTMPIAVEQINNHEVFIVDDGALIACFDPEVRTALVREIASRQPLRAVFRDSAFATDAERINAEQIFNEVSPATDVKAI